MEGRYLTVRTKLLAEEQRSTNMIPSSFLFSRLRPLECWDGIGVQGSNYLARLRKLSIIGASELVLETGSQAHTPFGQTTKLASGDQRDHLHLTGTKGVDRHSDAWNLMERGEPRLREAS